MPHIFRNAALAGLAFSLLGSTAHAGIFDKTPAKGGAYVSGFVGGAFAGDADFEGIQAPATGVPGVAGAPANINAGFDTDVVFGGAVGTRLPFKFLDLFQPRLEAEISYFESDVESGQFNTGSQTFGGEQSILFFLANSYSDIVWEENQKIVPYFGGGIGVGVVDNNITYFPNNGIANAPTFAVQGEDTAFATVSTIGVTAKATDRLEFYTEGRYHKIYGMDAERRFIANGNDGFSAFVEDNTDGFTLTVGTRLNF